MRSAWAVPFEATADPEGVGNTGGGGRGERGGVSGGVK